MWFHIYQISFLINGNQCNYILKINNNKIRILII
jgi:hypothetical protein